MSIVKPNFSGLVKEHIPFTVVPNYVVQNLNSLEALGLWTHLISLPETWEVNRAYLMNKFGIGRDKLDKILKYLIANYLIEYLWIKKPDGTVDKVKIKVNNGEEFLKKIVNKQQDDSTTLKTRRVVKQNRVIHYTENPLSGETAPIKEINKPYKKKREHVRKKRVPLPDNFMPDEKRLVLAAQKSKEVGLTRDQLINKFSAVSRDYGKVSGDWNAAFEKFLLDERPRPNFINNMTKNIVSPSIQASEIRCTVKEWGPGHPTWDSLHA